MERQKFIYFDIPWLTWEARQTVEEVTFFTLFEQLPSRLKPGVTRIREQKHVSQVY